MTQIGESQGSDGELMFCPDVQQFATGGEDRQPGTGRQQIGHHPCRGQHMFEVVE